MDSGSSSEGTDGGLSTSPGNSSQRYRTDSESSTDQAKQTRFILPGAPGTEPKILTMEEVSGVMKNIENMTLAHEIALNPDFKLKPFDGAENSLERRIKEIMHKAFWDVLKEELERTPPSYNLAIKLLTDIKEVFIQLASRVSLATLV